MLFKFGAFPSPSECPCCSKPCGSSFCLKQMPKNTFGYSRDEPQRALAAALTARSKLKNDSKLCCVEGREQLNLSLQPWSALHCDVKVCGCARLAVESKGNIGTFPCFLHSSSVAGWHTDNALSLCLLLAWGAARSGLAVPDTEEVQGRRPAPWGSTDHWAEGRRSVCVRIL